MISTKKLLTAVLALSYFAASAFAGSITPEMDKHILGGLDAIYRMDFDKAESESQKVIEIAPEHPYGYFGLAFSLLEARSCPRRRSIVLS